MTRPRLIVAVLFAGRSGDSWVFPSHDALGITIALLVVIKLRRVWRRVAARVRWDSRTFAGALGIVLVTAALGSGLLWATGVTPAIAGYSLLAWHDALGAVLAVTIALHMLLRAKPLRRRMTCSRCFSPPRTSKRVPA